MTTSTPASTTRRVVVNRRGGPEVLKLQTGDLPNPAADEARVRIEAAGVSAYDVMLRGRWFPGFPRLPYTPGEDFVGVVEAIGSNVRDLHIGQRVGAWTFGDAGGYAEHICWPAAHLVPVPAGLDPAIAVAMITNYLTASLALHQCAGVKKGECMLVQGAGGGLGSALLQLGRKAGIECFGCDAAGKHAQIRADGAEPIDYRTEDVAHSVRELTGGGADVVIDLVGGTRQLLRTYRALRPPGRLVMLGMAGTLQSGRKIIMPSLFLLGLLKVWPDGRRIATGPGMETYPHQHLDWYRNTLAGFFDMALKRRLEPRVMARLPLKRAAEAHEMLERGDVA